MSRRLSILWVLVSILTLSGCQEQQEDSVFEPIYLDVELSINPENGRVNDKVVFEALVSYGQEKVEDAYEVSFEIWRANDPEHENIVVNHTKDGIYRLEKNFEREGTYYVIAHVTAKDMHYMPKKEFVVGQRSEPEEDPSSTIMDDE